MSPSFVKQQLEAVVGDLGCDAIKTGMLASAEIVAALADALAALPSRSHTPHLHHNQSQPQGKGKGEMKAKGKGKGNWEGEGEGEAVLGRGLGPPPAIVVDPVLISTSGDALAQAGVAEAMLSRLFPLATVITPNVPEAEKLLGWPPGSVSCRAKQIEAARALHAAGGAQWVLLKGGHVPPTLSQDKGAPGSLDSARDSARDAAGDAVDVLTDGTAVHALVAPWVRTENTHGTGCTLASALACGLAAGLPPLAAARAAKRFVTSALASSAGLALGFGTQRPFHHSSLLTPRDALRNDPAHYTLYAVTDAGINARRGRTLGAAVAAAVAGGATVVQLREKGVGTRALCEAAAEALAACRRLGVPLIINDRADVAAAVGADGVHVGADDLPVAAARAMLGPLAIVGASVRTVEDARQAQVDGADYLGAGACFPTSTKVSSSHDITPGDKRGREEERKRGREKEKRCSFTETT